MIPPSSFLDALASTHHPSSASNSHRLYVVIGFFLHLFLFVIIYKTGKLEKINGEAQVIESDVSASNGVVHFIDRILTDILF